MSTSEQLERETEKARARISETLDELRAQMTPGHVVDRLVDYATDTSGGMFFRNLRQQAVDNPVPVALVGVGLAWLALSGRRASTNETSTDNVISRTTDKVSVAGDELAGDATSRVQRAARSAMDTAAETASTTYDVAADQARRAGDNLQKSVSDMRGKVAASGRSMMDFIHEQPLVLVGLGLAIGAAIGAAAPSTEAEDELMGETSDAVKDETADLAKEHLKKGQAVAERAWRSAAKEAETQGLVSSSSDGDGAFAAHPDSASNETPLLPTTEASASKEDNRSEL
jgi:hypothetical protein